jgi:hypothetical protein
MAGVPLVPPTLTPTATVVTQRSGNPWKPLAIVLALLLLIVLVAAALVATDVMKLGFSLL